MAEQPTPPFIRLVPLPPDIEAKIAECEKRAGQDLARADEVEKNLDNILAEIDSGELTFDEADFDDPSVVRHVEELNQRVRRDSIPRPQAAIAHAIGRARSHGH